VLNNETKLNLSNIKVIGAKTVVSGTNQKAIVSLNNVDISDNESGIKTAGSIHIEGNSTISNNGNGLEVTSSNSVITFDAKNSTINVNDKISGVTNSKLNLQNGTINLYKPISKLDVSMNNANINLKNDDILNDLNLTIEGQSELSFVNNLTSNTYLNNLTLNDNLNVAVDVDLAKKSMDTIIAKNYNLNNYFLTITKMNLLSDSQRDITKIFFADDNLKNNVKTSVSEIAYSPIWKYDVGYDRASGAFTFVRSATGNSNSYNPAILTTPVAAQLGGYIGMLDNYQNAFSHLDMNMLKPSKVRMAELNANKYTVLDSVPLTYETNDMNSNGVWVKPYVSYDSVKLKNSPKVNNTSYGSFIGGDFGIHRFKHGISGVFSPYIAYQGSHQKYLWNSIYQEGGNIGITGSLYKGNLFTGLTLGVGASVAEANTMYGHDNFGMLTTGVASKTGYNFEFSEGKYIVQPSLLLSYTMVDTFNYTNAAGVNVHSEPLHALQVAPQIKFVMNTEKGWQPYLTAGMNWNLIDETKMTANSTSLPEMSVKPYIQYGVGVQKTIKDRFTGFLQIIIRNGGRTGIVATGGMRCMIGKEDKNN
jgi:hypothetical protein